jgi:ATP-dependent helicase/nuclease subunit B
MNTDLYSALEAGSLIVTGNNRLARHLTLQYGREQQRRGAAAWLDPGILPWSVWVKQVWYQARLHPSAAASPLQLLSETQASLLWEQVIEQLAELHPTDNPMALARLASRSWTLRHQWLLAAAELRQEAYSPDQRAFADWSDAFGKRCKQRNWLTADELPAAVTEAFQAGLYDLKQPLCLVGFDELNPAQQQLVDAVQATGAEVRIIRPKDAPERCLQAVFTDPEAELQAAAEWARDKLERHPGESVAVLVPDLQQRAAEVRRFFMDSLMPDWRATSGAFLPPLNLSIGQPLADKGMISTALRLLALPWRALPFGEISLLLRSPYVGGFAAERNERAAAEVELRSRSIVELRAGAISFHVREQAPLLAQLLLGVPQWSKSALPSSWVADFSGLLKHCGWPGDQLPESSEYRAFTKWQALLEELSSLDAVLGKVSAAKALRVLRSLTANTLFQTEGNPDAVQIMGLLEASGQEFDHLWLCGLTTDAWPQSSQPDPLIPFTLQRKRNMPNSTPAITHHFAASLMRATLASCREPVVSWPRFRDDEELQPAPLPVTDVTPWQPGSVAAVSYQTTIFECRTLDTVSGDDDIPPPIPEGQKVYGGAGLLAQQAACPARAFVERRLGAKELRKAVSGLDPMTRGELMHEVLERWYTAYPDSSSLVTMSADVRASRLEALIAEMFAPRISREQGVLAIVTEQEALRLQLVVEQFFDLEVTRAPFTVAGTEEPRSVSIGGLDLKLRLDRLDRLTGGEMLVIDYKSSKISASRWAPPRPLEPQLPLYAVTQGADGIAIAQVASKGVRIDGWSDAETGIAGIKPVEKLKFDVDDWVDLVEAWRHSFEVLAQEFLAGDFRVNLDDLSAARGEFGLVIRTSELAGLLADETDEEGVDD